MAPQILVFAFGMALAVALPSAAQATSQCASIWGAWRGGELIETLSDHQVLADRVERAHEKVDELGLRPQVRELSEIDWAKEGGQFLAAAAAVKMKARAEHFPVEIQQTILAVYNRMHDKAAFKTYMEQLTLDAAREVQRRNIPKEMTYLQEGTILRNAVLRVLVQRSKARNEGRLATVVKGDGPSDKSRLTRKLGDNVGFREAVAQGPFFDKPLGSFRHGVDMHLLQKDFVADIVFETTNGHPQMFWDFLGSKKGISFWVPLFDSAEGAVGLSSPEIMRHMVIGYVPLR